MLQRRAILGLVAALCLLWAIPAHATIALVAHTLKQGADVNGSGTSSAIDTTGASLCVMIGSSTTATEAVPADSRSNSWTALTSYNQIGIETRMWYAQNPSVGTSHTFSFNGTATFGAMAVACFSGTATASVFDVENGATKSGDTFIQPGSVTPAANNSLVVFGFGDAVGETEILSTCTGCAFADQAPLIASQSLAIGLGYQIQTTAAAVNPTMTTSGSYRVEAAIAVFKPSAAAAAPVRHKSNNQ